MSLYVCMLSLYLPLCLFVSVSPSLRLSLCLPLSLCVSLGISVSLSLFISIIITRVAAETSLVEPPWPRHILSVTMILVIWIANNISEAKKVRCFCNYVNFYKKHNLLNIIYLLIVWKLLTVLLLLQHKYYSPGFFNDLFVTVIMYIYLSIFRLKTHSFLRRYYVTLDSDDGFVRSASNT